ncbi:MAG: hypothetical protein ABFD90_02915 [Phycisphaerales bacterium]
MKRRADTMKAAILVLSILAAVMLTGCISSHSDVKYGSKGPAVGSATLRQVKCGETTKDWLLTVLGEPTRATQTANGSEVLTYEYTKNIESDVSFCIFFDADDRREERTIYVFELENGVVTRYWKES